MKSVGIDIVENDRIRKSLSDSFAKKILSEEEFEKYSGFNESRKVEFLSGRFAVKEAIIKCLSDYELPSMKDLNVINNEKGKPCIEYKDYDIEISLSHERNYSVAIAILK